VVQVVDLSMALILVGLLVVYFVEENHRRFVYPESDTGVPRAQRLTEAVTSQ